MTDDTAARIAQIECDLISEREIGREDAPRRTLADEMARLLVPGVSVAVIDGGEIAWAKAYGVLERGTSAPCGVETRFQAASISKPVAAAALLTLIDEGTLDLDADVNDYLKSWRVPKVGAWQPRITLRQLLSHSAGTTVSGFEGYVPGTPVPSVPQVLSGEAPANSAPVLVDTVPGLQYRYSGGGTTIAQLAVMDVTGQAYAEFVRERVLDPLGMTRSTFAQPLHAHERDDAARAVDYRGEPIEGGWHVYPEQAAAGLWTTPTDLARFGLGLLRAQRGPGGFLSQARVQEMMTPHIAGDAGVMYQIGLGVYLSPIGDRTAFWHNGSNAGFKADWILFGDSGTGMVVMTSGDNGFILAGEIMRAIARAYGWTAYQPPARLRVYKPVITRLAAYCGDFRVDERRRLRVTAEGAGLRAEFDGQAPIDLVPVTETLFSAAGLNVSIDYALDIETETFPALVVKQNGRTFSGQRITEA
ncbi:MAG: beta-lactamase family protein [Chloroflexi bacterium]|nr:beta-lactamase family protein [Chloroflexota bacterium]